MSGGDNLEKTGDNTWPGITEAAVIRPRNMASTAEERGTVPQISGKMPVLWSGVDRLPDGERPSFSPTSTKRLEQLVSELDQVLLLPRAPALLFGISAKYVYKLIEMCTFPQVPKVTPFHLHRHRPQSNEETNISKSSIFF